MKRVFLAGTTTGTTWRTELIERLVQRGVRRDQIINPHLPPGVKYTTERMRIEERHQADPETIILIYICPAVVSPGESGSLSAKEKSELIGPISMYEIGRYAWAEPWRTAVVLDSERFTENRRPRRVLEKIARQLSAGFNGGPPYFPTLSAAEDWLVRQLA